MSGLLGGIRFFHSAIRNEAQGIGELARSLDAADEAQVTNLVDRFRDFRLVMKDHEATEEEILFPALDEKMPQVAQAYVLDHRAGESRLNEMDALMTDIQNATTAEERARLVAALQREAAVLEATLVTHMAKEEEHVVPLLEECCSLEEQGVLVDRMSAQGQTEHGRYGLTWTFRALSIDDREGLLRMFQERMPVGPFRGIAQGLGRALPPEDWAELARRIPELA